ncbi:MAG: hypothetical protein Q8P41_00115 [Pseudomonadota bacterium]|nr:hypothetical protein [Pseudomonadota bacterium]
MSTRPSSFSSQALLRSFAMRSCSFRAMATPLLGLLVTGGGGSWNALPLTDVPPALSGKGGTWGSVDDRTVYEFGGGGTWKGTLSW